jgi:mRNA-decapping enzyme subunit 2
MALLNAFKSGPRENTENKPLGNTPHEDTTFSQSSNQHQTQRQPVPWANVPSAQGSNPAAQYLPHKMAPVAPMRTSPRAAQPAATQHASKPPQPADSHRSALLEMFKRSGPRSPLSNEFKLQSSRPQQDDGSAKKDEPRSPSYKATSATNATMTASEVNGGPVKINAEPNLPHRPFQILSRPKQTERAQSPEAQAQMQRLQQRLNPQEPRNVGRQGLPSPRDRALLQQPEQEVKRSPHLNYAAAQAASLPYAQYSPSGTHAVPSSHHQQPTAALHRRKDSNPEQRQKLLSLFSKEQQPSPTGFSAEEKGKAREPPVFEQPRSSTPRSRVASLASAGGNEPAVGSSTASRRGSQTPISPADRSFLLSYLESVTNSAR